MKAILAAVALWLCVASAQAMQIQQFDKLSPDDQIDFINQLVDSVVNAAQGNLHARVERFFMNKQPGEMISGMGRFELNLSLARVADLDAVARNPKAHRLEVEDVMFATLERSAIVLPGSFRPTALHFRPKGPPSKLVMNAPEAAKALKQTQAWVAREVPAEHEFRQSTLDGLSGFPSNDKAIAFFSALASLVEKACKSGCESGSSSGPYSGADTRPWWQQNGYNTYQEASHAACIGSTTAANPSWCN